MNARPLRDGAVVFAGERIVEVGAAKELRSRFQDAIEHDFGSAVILPGLVNAHTHLELTEVARPPTPGAFTDWLRTVMAATSAGDPRLAAERGARAGMAQSLQFGVTCVGDITSFPAATRRVLAPGPLRVVSFGEVRAMAGRRGLLRERLAAALDPTHAQGTLRVGVSPHAPYSIEAEGYRLCLDRARALGAAIATHLAETVDEEPFLAAHAGPFRELWESIGGWDAEVPRFDAGPIEFASALGLLDYSRSLLAHVNYCDNAELALLAGGRASVVYCPRTHAYFDHPPHRWREMLSAGVNVAVGTDSAASAGDLNLVDDLRLLRRLAPEMRPEQIWALATRRAAQAIGMGDKVGTLEPNKAADCAVFPLSLAGDPLAEVLDSDQRPAHVWISGRRVHSSSVSTDSLGPTIDGK